MEAKGGEKRKEIGKGEGKGERVSVLANARL